LASSDEKRCLHYRSLSNDFIVKSIENESGIWNLVVYSLIFFEFGFGSSVSDSFMCLGMLAEDGSQG